MSCDFERARGDERALLVKSTVLLMQLKDYLEQKVKPTSLKRELLEKLRGQIDSNRQLLWTPSTTIVFKGEETVLHPLTELGISQKPDTP